MLQYLKITPALHLLDFRAVELLDVFHIWFIFSGSYTNTVVVLSGVNLLHSCKKLVEKLRLAEWRKLSVVKPVCASSRKFSFTGLR